MESVRVYYSDDYCHQGATFDTYAKAALVADRIRDDERIHVVAPRPVDTGELARIHDADYVTAVLTGSPEELATSNGFSWSPHLRDGVLVTTGGVRDAALHAMHANTISGSLSSGLHHAASGHGQGFCTLNGLALGALAARDAGANRVLILDLDAHCGGGTAQIINGWDGVEQFDLSVIGFDSYESSSNARLVMSDGPGYLNDLTRGLCDITQPEGIDLVIYNAGMDVHEDAGGVRGITTHVVIERERLVMAWCQHNDIPVAFVLAGGYSTARRAMGEVADLHVHTITAATDAVADKNSV